MEKLLAGKQGEAAAYQLLGPLHGSYQLRMGDAHRAGTEVNDAFRLVGVIKPHPLYLGSKAGSKYARMRRNHPI